MKKLILLLASVLVAIPMFSQDSVATATNAQSKFKIFKGRPK
jgi:hypothetical protein